MRCAKLCKIRLCMHSKGNVIPYDAHMATELIPRIRHFTHLETCFKNCICHCIRADCVSVATFLECRNGGERGMANFVSDWSICLGDSTLQDFVGTLFAVPRSLPACAAQSCILLSLCLSFNDVSMHHGEIWV